MTYEETISRRNMRKAEFVQNLYSLTSEDILVWEPAVENSDCEYIASFNDVTIQLNCDPQKKCFIVNDERIEISQEATKILCHLIAAQRLRQPNEKKDAIIAKANKVFADALAANSTDRK